MVLHVHNVRAMLAEKDITRDPYRIVEFCNAKSASAFLNADPKIGLDMPCRINVYVQKGKVIFCAMHTIVLL